MKANLDRIAKYHRWLRSRTTHSTVPLVTTTLIDALQRFEDTFGITTIPVDEPEHRKGRRSLDDLLEEIFKPRPRSDSEKAIDAAFDKLAEGLVEAVLAFVKHREEEAI